MIFSHITYCLTTWSQQASNIPSNQFSLYINKLKKFQIRNPYTIIIVKKIFRIFRTKIQHFKLGKCGCIYRSLSYVSNETWTVLCLIKSHRHSEQHQLIVTLYFLYPVADPSKRTPTLVRHNIMLLAQSNSIHYKTTHLIEHNRRLLLY